MTTLLVIYILSVLLQIYFYIIYFAKLDNREIEKMGDLTLPLSVIIAAKNEEVNFKKNIQYLLSQNYPQFELIIIDDHSTDETTTVLNSLNDNRLSFYSLIEGDGKKKAIELGIKKAKYNHLVFIDTDCKPASNKWLQHLAGKFNGGKKIVLGYGSFKKYPSFLNKITRFEGFLNATQYFSFALAGNPYMGVGRNLAYTKEIFLKSNAFEKHSKIKSGDDDLLVNEMATALNTSIAVHPDSHTITEPKRSWSEYFHQKRRQLLAGTKYKAIDRFRLMLFGLSNFSFYYLSISIIISGSSTLLFLIIFLFKILLQIAIFKRIMSNLGEKDLLFWIPILECFYLLFISIVGISTWVWKVNRWK